MGWRLIKTKLDLFKMWKWNKSFQTPNLLCHRCPNRGWLKHLFFWILTFFFSHPHLNTTVHWLHSWSKVGKAHWRKWHHGAIKFFNNSWKKFATCWTWSHILDNCNWERLKDQSQPKDCSCQVVQAWLANHWNPIRSIPLSESKEKRVLIVFTVL